MKKARKSCEAYFLSPIGKIVPVLEGTHIRQIIAEPMTFGLTLELIRAVYDRYGEELGSEKGAREKIIKGLLEKGWIRVRIEGNSYINCQIGCDYERSRRIYKNIVRLLAHIMLVRGDKEFSGLGLRVYIRAGYWLINAYDASESKKMLIEKITVKKDGK